MIDRFRGLVVYVRDGFSAYRQRNYECGCCEVIVVRISSSSQNFRVFGVYRNPDLSDKIVDCLLTVMAKVRFVYRKAFFLFVGDVNAHHNEYLGSSMTNLHGRVASDFASLSGCEQMGTEPTLTNSRVLDLVLTDVPDVVGIRVALPVGASVIVPFLYRLKKKFLGQD